MNVNPHRYGEAARSAAHWHSGQVRKGTDVPYVSHPIAVSALVMQYAGDEDQAIAALFHDVLEDCGWAYERDIRSGWGNEVLKIVVDLTDRKPDEALGWEERKVRYLAHMREMPMKSFLVTACDKLHNCESIMSDYLGGSGEGVFDRFTAGRTGTIWYYSKIGEILSERLGDDHALTVRFRAALDYWA